MTIHSGQLSMNLIVQDLTAIPPSARPDRYLARSQTRLETYQVGPVVQPLSLEGHPTRFGEVERVSAVRWQGYLLPSNIWSQE